MEETRGATPRESYRMGEKSAHLSLYHVHVVCDDIALLRRLTRWDFGWSAAILVSFDCRRADCCSLDLYAAIRARLITL